MTVNQKSSEASKIQSEKSVIFTLLQDIGSTTWRMFIPIIALLLIGNWLDNKFSTPNIFLIICVIVGSTISGFLITRQLKKSK